jgi:tRNA pseudouridine55 synthase
MSKPRRVRNAVHGWLVIDKPQGMTSTQIVTFLKKLYSPEKIGHAGTLDPLATGVLPIAFGEATKTVAYAVEGAKTYLFTVRWGEERDTDDVEGKVTKTSANRPTVEDIEAMLPQFCGRIQQTPPQFSAVKIAGERAYDIARDGQTVDLKPREVFVESLKVEDMPDADMTAFRCKCGKGTYVRAIARDLGRALSCFGHVSSLRRTKVGPFSEESAVSLQKLQDYQGASQAGENGLDQLLLPVATVLDDIPALAVLERDAERLRHGRPVLLRGQNAPLSEGAAYASCAGELIALGNIAEGQFLPTRVFNLSGKAASLPGKMKEYADVGYRRAQAGAR